MQNVVAGEPVLDVDGLAELLDELEPLAARREFVECLFFGACGR